MSPITMRVSGGLEDGLLKETYYSLCKKLDQYRLSLDWFEARKGVLPFVRGLRFSALLIYSIRKVITEPTLKASWGVILDDEGLGCSRECDIIVHRGRYAYAWDGDDSKGKRVMDFRFIRHNDARLVVSCKSEVDSVDGEIRDYAQNLEGYVKRIWLFAECCKTGRADALRKRAREAGYERFWYLYTLKEGRVGQEYNEPGWMAFVEELRSLEA